MIPSAQQLRNWTARVEQLISATAASGLNHDLGTVLYRLERELPERRAGAPIQQQADAQGAARREVEGGCAWRILRLATDLRAHAQQASVAATLADMAHDLAGEIVVAELAPCPDWSTMCGELGWPVAPIVPTVDYAAHLPAESFGYYLLRQPATEVILIAFTPYRISYARGLARDAQRGGAVARRLFPLCENGEPHAGVSLAFVLARGAFADLTGSGAFDNVGKLHGDATADHERLLRQHLDRHGPRGLQGLGSCPQPASLPQRVGELPELACPRLVPLATTATAQEDACGAVEEGPPVAADTTTAMTWREAHAAVMARRAIARPAKLDPFLDRLGREPDAVVASAAGVDPKTVRTFRERRGIAAHHVTRLEVA